MASGRGKKRKHKTDGQEFASEDDQTGAHFDRETWPGWVEMESEPAYFNVMLKEMGVKGVKIQDVYSMDEDMLSILPKPVHAMIFLFRYRDADWSASPNDTCPEGIWFANQTPDFACATFALLNIVYNIPGLHLGTELQAFKDRTLHFTPLQRGDAIDEFDFVRRVHNSFASENDMLETDLVMKQRADKWKRMQAAQKGRETRYKNMNNPDAAIKDEYSLPGERKSTRARKPTLKTVNGAASPASNDDNLKPNTTIDNAPEASPRKPLRRSSRAAKPRLTNLADTSDSTIDDGEEGFHFIAYMPIGGHVWKLDGLNRFPTDMGPYHPEKDSLFSDWMRIVRPALVDRMAQYEGAEIEFNLMAVVHDTLDDQRASLLCSMNILEAIDSQLKKVYIRNPDSKQESTPEHLGVDFNEAENQGLDLNDMIPEEIPGVLREQIEQEENVEALLALREQHLMQYRQLRAAVRDGIEAEQKDAEKARHRRHDYGTFVREWLLALANEQVLADLLAEMSAS